MARLDDAVRCQRAEDRTSSIDSGSLRDFRNRSKNTLEAFAIEELKKFGVKVFPGMEVEYVVVDFDKKVVSVRNPESFDFDYYAKILRKAFEEVKFAVNFAKCTERKVL